jgi:hypothetical protein
MSIENGQEIRINIEFHADLAPQKNRYLARTRLHYHPRRHLPVGLRLIDGQTIQ